MAEHGESGPGTEIAIIGMAGRFPGADNLERFWENLCNGVESIRFFTEVELRAAGVDADAIADPAYVRAAGALDGLDGFDADFFGFTPREAETTDPQQRIFLECAWEALENAGYDPAAFNGLIGAFAGAGQEGYLWFNLAPNRHRLEGWDDYQMMLRNSRDFLVTRVCYELDLRGPGLSIQTACSTSLVAVHAACQSLLNGECDMALAGGVSVMLPQFTGYRYREGGILSPDGHCRAFDVAAQGMVSGSGAGVVLLKRLGDAQADRDHIYAVIKGSAINNDGALKVSFTAPSVVGQAAVVAEAMDMAGVDAGTVGYLEAHGTGTALGDMVEISALTEAYGARTREKGFCAIGAVKPNIGHLDAAAGVAGLIKTALALHHGVIPPTIHFKEPNPRIDFGNSPFYVNQSLTPWPRPDLPRRAGVSSFGIGGTNAHVVLEQAPPVAEQQPLIRPLQLVLLSARTPAALEQATVNLAAHLLGQPDIAIADVAFTSQMGRRSFKYRRAVVCSSLRDAILSLHMRDATTFYSGSQGDEELSVIFVFPDDPAGQPLAGKGLYAHEPAFRKAVDRCSEIIYAHTGDDLATLFRSLTDPVDIAPHVSRLAHFTLAYALAEVWREWGVKHHTVAGQGVGRCVAAVVAGAVQLEEALALVGDWDRDSGLQDRIDRFSDSIAEVAVASTAIRLHMGPGSSPMYEAKGSAEFFCLSAAEGAEPELPALLGVLGQLWTRGVAVDWAAFTQPEARRRVPLPTYPFERRSFWIDAPGAEQPGPAALSAQAVDASEPSAEALSVAPIHSRPNLMTPFVAPANELEQAIADVFTEFLGIGEIGVHDDFFELGGDSMAVTLVVARIREFLLVEFPLSVVFEGPTVGQIAAALEQMLLEQMDEAPDDVAAGA